MSDARTIRTLDEALQEIASIRVRAVEPWTQEMAADAYSAALDRAQVTARRAMAKARGHT